MTTEGDDTGGCLYASMTGQPGSEVSDAVLLQTSALRVYAEALAADPSDERFLTDIVRAGRALSAALRQRGLDVLGGDVLEKMALLGKTLSGEGDAAAADVFRGLTSAIGILEQSLDAALFGAAPEQLEEYGDRMLDALPARWQPYVEAEEDDRRQSSLDKEPGA